MLQKLALAVKSKTIEFFAEEDEEDEDRAGGADLDSAEEVITGQRVVVIKPDSPIGRDNGGRNPSAPSRGLISSVFATVSSFHAAYLNLQIAHEPFQPDAIAAADRAAVLHLQRLSDLRQAYHLLRQSPEGAAARGLAVSSQVQAQVQENQSMLRKFEAVFNRLQSDIDGKDAEVSALKEQLREMEASNSLLERKLKAGSASPSVDDGEKLVLSIGSSMLFSRRRSEGVRGDPKAAANSIYQDVVFLKGDHHGYALLSYFCLGMFGSFASEEFSSDSHGDRPSPGRKRQFFREFIKQCLVDPTELLATEPEGQFARFCERKYCSLIKPSIGSLPPFSAAMDTPLGSWGPSNPLYEPFVSMSSLVWAACRLAMAFEGPIEIFRVQPGVDFCMVFMENVLGKNTLLGMNPGRAMPKVGFTVFPGFRHGPASTIQCKVYLNYRESSP
ncbi:unnamed protein product [Spirodela intermedia]|uniref:Uncharacterized protein n=1 Tax=Spirodela intermedia TaxID=51605 RepID=A0A7I8J9N8_SPIIN|nr:unnamed protein product [Spirodela intermedia]CAA6666814.1 unnamed protein product [Spirodela intermedia]